MISRSSKVAVTTGLGLNLASAIGIVLINKHIYVQYAYPSMSLTLVHFVITSIGLQICVMLEIFTPKKLPVMEIIPLALSFCGFVVFTNLSLQFNTLGTYQLIKSLTTPVILFLQYILYYKQVSILTIFTVIPVMVGIFINSYYDVYFNFMGFMFAIIGVMVTSIYQIWVGAKQTDFAANSMQLLYYQAPLASLMLFFMVMMWEPYESAALLKLPTDGILWILGSGVVAFMVNLSIFWVIGKTSPLTYNMAGHFKFCVTLLAGHYLFGEDVDPNQMLGVGCTVSGLFLYSFLKISEQDTILDPLPSRPRHMFTGLGSGMVGMVSGMSSGMVSGMSSGMDSGMDSGMGSVRPTSSSTRSFRRGAGMGSGIGSGLDSGIGSRIGSGIGSRTGTRSGTRTASSGTTSGTTSGATSGATSVIGLGTASGIGSGTASGTASGSERRRYNSYLN